MKPTRSGTMKNFNISSLDEFFVGEKMEIDNVLTRADRQMILKYALDSIKARENERFLPGTESVQLYHGQSIVDACLEEALIENVYSLRDMVSSPLWLVASLSQARFTQQEYLKKWGPPWYKGWFQRQPLNKIREYFGESIGIYFAFVGKNASSGFWYKFSSFSSSAEYHTVALIAPAILGIFQYFLTGGYVPFFCIFYIIWMLVSFHFTT